MLQSLGLVGTIAEGDEGPEDPESEDSEDEEVSAGRTAPAQGQGGAAASWIGPGWIAGG